MPSFDIVSQTDLQDVDNAVNTMKREMENRYDFKGTKCAVERKEAEITFTADDDYKLKAMQEMLKVHFSRKKIEASALDFGEPEKASGNTLRQIIKVKQGIPQDIAKEVVKKIKDSKIKVQGSIRGEELRVTGNKRDDLQAAITLVRGMNLPLPLQFINFRD